jgi:hypothetical protein
MLINPEQQLRALCFSYTQGYNAPRNPTLNPVRKKEVFSVISGLCAFRIGKKAPDGQEGISFKKNARVLL